jgi:hypothetical protein
MSTGQKSFASDINSVLTLAGAAQLATGSAEMDNSDTGPNQLSKIVGMHPSL